MMDLKTRQNKCLLKSVRVTVKKLTEEELDKLRSAGSSVENTSNSESKSKLVLKLSKIDAVAGSSSGITIMESTHSDRDTDNDNEAGEDHEEEVQDVTPKPKLHSVPIEGEPSSSSAKTKKVKLVSTGKKRGGGGHFSLAYTRDKISGQFKCKHCEEIFFSHTSALNHYKRDHLGVFPPPPPQEERECEECGKQFANKSSLKKHQDAMICGAKKGMLKKEVCEGCGKEFTRKWDMKRHQESTCAKEGGGRVSCPECGSSVNAKYGLFTHYKKVHPELKFPT